MVIHYYEEIVHIKVNSIEIEGSLEIPANAKGIVLFAHGSGSSRYSPRNNFVAQVFRQNGLATLLIDLLTETEDLIYKTRFDIDLLTDRLLTATKWLQNNAKTEKLSISYFGASTGAAAALMAAARLGKQINTVVSRGGRPDLAEPDLPKIQSPTLLIVGGNDEAVLELNQDAYNKLTVEKELVIIPGATHLFGEPGALEEVANLAATWFKQHFLI
ncbi:MAG: hydrolase [Candidatus Melainabacteria bacterium RIFOXYA12_FULL_32_12]|nr:MAG: hydrolase [Candidatus Melainabacteria bacterium RIFOXYA12_FULL_32_12]